MTVRDHSIGRPTVPTYAEIRDRARVAEGLGFDSIWVYDHLLFQYGEHDRYGAWEMVAFPDFADLPASQPPHRSGTPKEIAAVPTGYHDAGVVHVMLDVVPNSSPRSNG